MEIIKIKVLKLVLLTWGDWLFFQQELIEKLLSDILLYSEQNKRYHYCVWRRRMLPNLACLLLTQAKVLRAFWLSAGSYDVTFSLRKGFCLVRHKILSSSRTLGVGIGVGGCVVNFVAARSRCILRVVNFVAALGSCILSSSRTLWLLLFSR